MVSIEFFMGVWVLYVWAIAHAVMPNGSVSNGEVCILSSEILSWNLFSALEIGVYTCRPPRVVIPGPAMFPSRHYYV